MTHFSRRSRRRLLELFARLRWSLYEGAWFVTLTWHHALCDDPRRAQEVLNQFLTEFRRDLPGFDYVWRMEPQKRGVPHFHLMLLPRRFEQTVPKETVRQWCRDAWHRIADPTSDHHKRHGVLVDYEPNYRRASAYLSKYTAKETDESFWGYPGRRWGASRGLDVSDLEAWDLAQNDFEVLLKVAKRMLRQRGRCRQEWIDNLGASQQTFLWLDREQVDEVVRQLDEEAPGWKARGPTAPEWEHSYDEIARAWRYSIPEQPRTSVVARPDQPRPRMPVQLVLGADLDVRRGAQLQG